MKDQSSATFPAGWTMATLGELFDFSNGVNTDKSAYGSGVRFANVLEVITNESLDEHQIPGRVALARSIQRRYEVRHGDVLFNRTSETQNEVGLSSVYVGRAPVVFGGFVLRGRSISDLLEPQYAKYALRAGYVRDQIIARGQGGIRANIGQRDLRSVVVHLPPVPEQRAIASAIDAASEEVDAVRQVIEKKQKLKLALMQQLLSGRTRLSGFTDEWKSKRVGDFAQVRAGGTPSRGMPQYWGGDIPWMSSGEIHQKRVSHVRGRITSLGLARSSAHVFPAGTVLMALAGQGKTRGTVAVSRIELTTNQSIAGIFPGDEHNADYLFYNLDSRYQELRGESTGDGGRGGLNLSIIKDVLVPLPSIAEQHSIATILGDADAELDLLTARLSKSRSVKRGLAQELVLGRTQLGTDGASL